MTPEGKRLLVVVLAPVLFVVAVVYGSITVYGSWRITPMPLVVNKDFLQEWNMARAALEGIDPYTPTPILVERWLPGMSGKIGLPNPSPHPPGAIWVGLPFAMLPYTRALQAWFVLELLLVAHLVLRSPGAPTRGAWRVGIWFALMSWEPVYRELFYGQINLLAACILLEALRAEGAYAGGLHGIALAVKIAGWPLLLHRLLSGQRVVVVVAAAVAGLLILLTTAWIGVGSMVNYAVGVAPEVSALYRGNEWNIAPSAIAYRCFAGTTASPLIGNDAPALLDFPHLAVPASAVATLAWVSGSLAAATRIRDPRLAGSFLIAAGAVANPVSWNHGLVAAVPALLAVRPRADLPTAFLTLTIVLNQVNPFQWRAAAAWVMENWPTLGPAAPFLSSLPLLLVPAIGICLIRHAPAPEGTTSPHT